MDDAEGQNRILRLWFKRPTASRTLTDVHKFYRELLENHPELLVSGNGDQFDHLKTDLRGYILDADEIPLPPR